MEEQFISSFFGAIIFGILSVVFIGIIGWTIFSFIFIALFGKAEEKSNFYKMNLIFVLIILSIWLVVAIVSSLFFKNGLMTLIAFIAMMLKGLLGLD